MSENLGHTNPAPGPMSIVTACADRESAAAVLAALRQSGIEEGSILCMDRRQANDGAADSPFARATGQLDATDRQTILSGLPEDGMLVIVSCRSDQEQDQVVAALQESHGEPAGSLATGPDGSLPDGIRGTIRDTPYTVPQEEHAGYGEPFPDKFGSQTEHSASPRIYVIRGT